MRGCITDFIEAVPSEAVPPGTIIFIPKRVKDFYLPPGLTLEEQIERTAEELAKQGFVVTGVKVEGEDVDSQNGV